MEFKVVAGRLAEKEKRYDHRESGDHENQQGPREERASQRGVGPGDGCTIVSRKVQQRQGRTKIVAQAARIGNSCGKAEVTWTDSAVGREIRRRRRLPNCAAGGADAGNLPGSGSRGCGVIGAVDRRPP